VWASVCLSVWVCACNWVQKSEGRIMFVRQMGIIEIDVLCTIGASVCPFVCVCVCGFIQSQGNESCLEKRNRCFRQIYGNLLKLTVVCEWVSVCVCACVWRDRALAYNNNTRHYRSVSVLRELVYSLSLRQLTVAASDDDDPESYPFAVAPNASMSLCFFQLNSTFLPHTNCHSPVGYTTLRSRTAYVLMGNIYMYITSC
jgi:hypothetical protein